MHRRFFRCALAATLIPSGLLFGFQSAMAEEAGPATRGDETCFPIETAYSRLKTADLKLDRRDTVDTFLEASFADVENRSLPMKLYLKSGNLRDSFVITEDGEIVDFHTQVLGAPNGASICGPSRVDGKIGLFMSTSVRFKNNSGTHTLAEILDGTRDGKSHHKKNVSGVKAMFVPKMTHVAIVYDVPDAVPKVSVIPNGASIPVEPESYGEMWVINVKDLEDSNIEALTIGDGPYELFPVPSIKKMKSLGIK